MKVTDEQQELSTLHNQDNYYINDLESEIAVDQLCKALLKRFHHHLLQERHLEPLESGSQAAGADYFLREFMIGKLQKNIFHATADDIRKFAGHWYIISNLEPNMGELSSMLTGAASFYRYCAEHKLTPVNTAEEITNTCQRSDYFRQRIEDFHNNTGDGYSAWEQACPL